LYGAGFTLIKGPVPGDSDIRKLHRVDDNQYLKNEAVFTLNKFKPIRLLSSRYFVQLEFMYSDGCDCNRPEGWLIYKADRKVSFHYETTGAVVEAQRDNWLYLRDGRRVGFLACGDASGRPVLYCHGFPGSRLEVPLADRIVAQKGIRLIGVDRPGYGLSDDRPGRSLNDWADDVAELADHLGIERYSILGASPAVGCMPYREVQSPMITPLSSSVSSGLMGKWAARI